MQGGDIAPKIETIMDDVVRDISFGIGPAEQDPAVDHELFDEAAWALELSRA